MLGHRGTSRIAVLLLIVGVACLTLAGWRGMSGFLMQLADARKEGLAAFERQPGTPEATPGESAALSISLAMNPAANDDDILPAAGSTGPGAVSVPAAAGPAPSAAPAHELFPGIADSVSRLWTFPMKASPETPAIGVFNASRSGRLHAGIDLYAPAGTEIFAMTRGRVFNIEVFYQGLMCIDVANDDGTTIRYGELMNTVQAGDTVERGQLLGRLKRNRDGTCMLHLEIYASIRPDPLTQIENKNDYPLVPVQSRSYRRRSDLVNPGAVYTLGAP